MINVSIIGSGRNKTIELTRVPCLGEKLALEDGKLFLVKNVTHYAPPITKRNAEPIYAFVSIEEDKGVLREPTITVDCLAAVRKNDAAQKSPDQALAEEKLLKHLRGRPNIVSVEFLQNLGAWQFEVKTAGDAYQLYIYRVRLGDYPSVQGLGPKEMKTN